MKVAYLTTYYNGKIDGRFGRFHDWIHALRDMDDPPFDPKVVALTASNVDCTVPSEPHALFGEATELWGRPTNKLEFCYNLPRAKRDLDRIDFDVIHVLTLDMIAFPFSIQVADVAPVVGPDIMGYTPRREGERWKRGGTTWMKDRVRFAVRKQLISARDELTPIALSRHHARNISTLDPEVSPKILSPGVSEIFSPEDTDRSAKEAWPTEFLYLGDLSKYKGYYVFLDALAQLPRNLDYRATVVGSGDPDRERIAALGLSDRVSIEGFIPRSDLPKYYRRADFYVMPSVDENGPNTIVEALACGTPVIATDKLGMNEYATKSSAIYVERTPADFRKAMVEAHENRERYSRNARNRANEYKIFNTIDGLVDVYESHLERTNP